MIAFGFLSKLAVLPKMLCHEKVHHLILNANFPFPSLLLARRVKLTGSDCAPSLATVTVEQKGKACSLEERPGLLQALPVPITGDFHLHINS